MNMRTLKDRLTLKKDEHINKYIDLIGEDLSKVSIWSEGRFISLTATTEIRITGQAESSSGEI